MHLDCVRVAKFMVNSTVITFVTPSTRIPHSPICVLISMHLLLGNRSADTLVYSARNTSVPVLWQLHQYRFVATSDFRS